MELFKQSGAEFSACRKYRYALWRVWDELKPKVMFIGLNPSTANETNNDPTIRRVIRFANQWGYGGVYMMNLFAFVTPYPQELKTCSNPKGDNDHWLESISLECERVIFAWGSFDVFGRDEEIKKMFKHADALIINKDGSPRHPLYVKGNIVPITYK